MVVRLAQEAEDERLLIRDKIRKAKWEYSHLTDLETAKNEAIKLGWLENRVQLRQVSGQFGPEYLIEPYEAGCHCSSIIRPPRAYGIG